MRKHTLLASALAVLLAGTVSAAFIHTAHAQEAPAPAAASTSQATTIGHHRSTDRMRNQRGNHPRDGLHNHGHQGGALADLHALERLYLQTGRGKELTALYNDVLAKSHDPQLRTYVHHRLAHLQAQPTNVDEAIATLRKSLDENLANEARRRAEHEQMRKDRQPHRAAEAAATPDSH